MYLWLLVADRIKSGPWQGKIIGSIPITTIHIMWTLPKPVEEVLKKAR